jgi:hypothetical protein
MNIIVDKPQLVRAVKSYLTKFFGDLTPKTSEKDPNSVFYVNSENEIIILYDEDTNHVWIDYGKIWSKLESLFHIKYDDIQLIMVDWLGEHYGLRKFKLKSKYLDTAWFETIRNLIQYEHNSR